MHSQLSLCIIGLSLCTTATANRYQASTPSTNDFGGIGLLQTPTARFSPEGTLTIGGSGVSPYNRYYITLQPLPWVEGTFRYTEITNRLFGEEDFSGDQTLKDKGGDIKLKIWNESRYVPQLAIGIRDVGGTALFGSEYVVVSKRYYNWDFSFGLGFGNLGTRGHFKNPLASLSSIFADRDGGIGEGGKFRSSYFSGNDVAFFGGVEYLTPIDNLRLKLEYDGNNYQNEPQDNNQQVDFPLNFGALYRPFKWLDLSLGLERGNTVMAAISIKLDLNHLKGLPKFDPSPVKIRPKKTVLKRKQPIISSEAYADALIQALEQHEFTVNAIDLESPLATAYLSQSKRRKTPKAIGRASRIFANVLPESYAAFKIVDLNSGLQTHSVTLFRQDLENALNLRSTPEEIWLHANIEGPGTSIPKKAIVNERRYPKFDWSITPGLRQQIGGPDGFYLFQIFASLGASIEFTHGLSLTGRVGIDIFNNFDKITLASDSVLPHVRSDVASYLQQGENNLIRLELDYLWNPAHDWYARLSAGIFEEMYGGVSGELLYRRYGSRLAYGVNLNYLKQRDFDQRFSFQDYEVLTGHFTVYYDLPFYESNLKISAGRYLAKDYGVTFDISKRFESGVVLGAFATLTNVPFKEFGEGSFDKGIYFSAPLELFFIKSSRAFTGISYRPLTRDGGQKVLVGKTLYPATTGVHPGALSRDWGQILH